jgi:hypothetical protein
MCLVIEYNSGSDVRFPRPRSNNRVFVMGSVSPSKLDATVYVASLRYQYSISKITEMSASESANCLDPRHMTGRGTEVCAGPHYSKPRTQPIALVSPVLPRPYYRIALIVIVSAYRSVTDLSLHSAQVKPRSVLFVVRPSPPLITPSFPPY